MLGRLFGRRTQSMPVAPHPGPDADGVARVFPKEVFDGPNGDFLRQMGFSPDDPANILPTQNSVEAKSDAIKRELDQLVTSVNDELGRGLEVIPWAMVPWSVWSRDPAGFMMVTCEFYPASRWNTMLLPANAKTAVALGLPEHPRAAVEGLEDAAANVFSELEQDYAKYHAKVDAALARGDTSVLTGVTETQRQYAGQAAGIARHFGHAVFGEQVAKTHAELFGSILWSKV